MAIFTSSIGGDSISGTDCSRSKENSSVAAVELREFPEVEPSYQSDWLCFHFSLQRLTFARKTGGKVVVNAPQNLIKIFSPFISEESSIFPN